MLQACQQGTNGLQSKSHFLGAAAFFCCQTHAETGKTTPSSTTADTPAPNLSRLLLICRQEYGQCRYSRKLSNCHAREIGRPWSRCTFSGSGHSHTRRIPVQKTNKRLRVRELEQDKARNVLSLTTWDPISCVAPPDNWDDGAGIREMMHLAVLLTLHLTRRPLFNNA